MFLSRVGASIVAVLLGGALLGSVMLTAASNREVGFEIRMSSIPIDIGSWQGRDTEGLGIKELDVLKLDQYLRRFYRSPEGQDVYVYVGYWKKQTGDYQGAKHSPSICLPSAGWVISPRGSRVLVVNDREVTMRVLRADFRGQRRFFFYWFFSGERTFAEEWEALFQLSVGSLLYGRSDGGIVELAVDVPRGEDEAIAEAQSIALAERFVREFFPHLQQLLKGSSAAGRPAVAQAAQ